MMGKGSPGVRLIGWDSLSPGFLQMALLYLLDVGGILLEGPYSGTCQRYSVIQTGMHLMKDVHIPTTHLLNVLLLCPTICISSVRGYIVIGQWMTAKKLERSQLLGHPHWSEETPSPLWMPSPPPAVTGHLMSDFSLQKKATCFFHPVVVMDPARSFQGS